MFTIQRKCRECDNVVEEDWQGVCRKCYKKGYWERHRERVLKEADTTVRQTLLKYEHKFDQLDPTTIMIILEALDAAANKYRKVACMNRGLSSGECRESTQFLLGVRQAIFKLSFGKQLPLELML